MYNNSCIHTKAIRPGGPVAFLFVYFFVMRENLVYLHDVHQTAEQMRRLTEQYYTDLGGWLRVPLMQYYLFVCTLPYVSDPIGVETVSRPLYTLQRDYRPRDCDDKSVLLASWCHGNGIKKRFVSTSTRPDKRLCHVFLQLENGLLMDSTYPKFKDYIGNYPYFSRVTKFEPLTAVF